MSEIAKYIDHTFLHPAGDLDAVRKLCREAKKYGFASVCVNPCEVERAAKLLKKSNVKVCSVVDFPFGASDWTSKCMQAAGAVQDGADELDVVVNIRQLKAAAAGDEKALMSVLGGLEGILEIKNLAKKDPAAGQKSKDVVFKLILECCYLTDEEKELGCWLAEESGFDFVKTSTGFGPGGATVHDVKLLRRKLGKKVGVKAAGGIRTLADARAMIAAGATRLGCSASVAIVKEEARQ